ncbi:MCE family protein [Planosporangium flavigriseum]|uniref:ABC transporter substrate-binding protein n=1 Tax=Planosporangium flavigriseum TaxID=373681 RepID=A0A8J3PK85_9ACTN|nr:MCE family protein [Planosporangium flavigriseum]NJC65014.1 MCE family protein [Planosporangium flavigriseum]GIG71628.1 ABC transporter substrate-binding protein [Planosporangium flavigriseum]
MITRTVRLQVIAFLVVSVLGIVYVAVNYVRLGDRLVGSAYRIHADFDEAGGIFTNAPVTYRGVSIGRVVGVNLHDGGVRVDMRVEGGNRIPTDLHAVVTQRSAVGEQYVDLRPNTDAGPYLADGGVIPRSKTGRPLPPEVLLTNLDALVGSVNAQDLTTVIDELGTAFEGSELALKRLLDANSALLEEANRTLPEQQTLIRDGKTVLTTQIASSDAIRRWAAALAELSATLRSSDPDLRKLLANGPPAAQQLVGLLDDLDPTIGTLLGNLITVNGITARRLPGFEQALVVYPMVVAGGFTVVPGDGTVHFGLVTNAGDPPSCNYVASGQPQVCTAAELRQGSNIRGSQRAPRPGGAEPAPPGPSSGGPSSSAPGQNVTGYDPATGLITGPDGLPLQFGGTGGQYQLAGEQSWKHLLLAGLAP